MGKRNIDISKHALESEIKKNPRQQKYDIGDEWLYDIDNAISKIKKSDLFYKNNLIEKFQKVKWSYIDISYTKIEAEKIRRMDNF